PTDAVDPGALQEEPGSSLYPEWDHRRGFYRDNWVRVRESVAPSGSSSAAYREALRIHRALQAQIRRQFERIAPETLKRIRGVREGEDLDIDAAIDALADLREGVPPREDVYITRRKEKRDVAVIFLVDLSSSTWLSVDTGHEHRKILEIERESLSLLIEPLVTLGDQFGMYGFSGTGRDDVRFVVIKGLEEQVSPEVIARLDALRPIQTTRMGGAIRHAATKLRGLNASTRLLVIISDGRPFDLEYGQQYGKGAANDYAISDTRAAIDEVRALGVRPFLLTVDSNGRDYLRTMCNGLDYEVLANVADLPARLASLYGHLTAKASSG
ncbi:MAG: VWA domain-containing protein, partial [Deltaproteobacteria bacterium]|nr:VWA domain-containing protein [Deltaproteobacteria bacterium]